MDFKEKIEQLTQSKNGKFALICGSAFVCLLIVFFLAQNKNETSPEEKEEQATLIERNATQIIDPVESSQAPQGQLPEESNNNSGAQTRIREYTEEEREDFQEAQEESPEYGNIPDLYDGENVEPETDPYDTKEFQEATDKQVSFSPLLQVLPIKEKSINANISGGQGSKIEVTVSYSGSLTQAKKDWQKLLKKYKDNGRAYAAVFKSK